VATATVQRLGAFNRRTLDVLAARLYHYYSLAHERTDTLPTIRRCSAFCKFPTQWNKLTHICVCTSVMLQMTL